MMKKLVAGLLLFSSVTFALAAERRSNSNRTPTTEDIDSLMKKVELIPIMVSGEKDNRINIVIMNRWTAKEKEPYNSPKMRGEFVKDIEESLIAALTPGDERAQTAYANYRAFFNIYGLWYPDSPEWDKGIDGKQVDAIRDRLFLPWKDRYTGWVTFLVMPNQDGGGGGAARNLEQRVGTALIAGKGIGKMLHEIAHTCMSIGDEYTAGGTGTSAIPTYTIEKNYDRDTIKWRKWIEPNTPLPTPYTKAYQNKVGAFEGAQYHLTDYFRSTAQGCIMGSGVFDNTEHMCPLCEQRVAMRVYTLVNPISSYTPSNTSIAIPGRTTLHFEIDHLTPIPNTQVVRWILNGKTIATGTDAIDIELGDIANYSLVCSLTDETPFIRPDPPYAKHPKHEVRWTIANSSPTSTATPLSVEIQRTVEQGESTLLAAMSGGTPPYTCLWSNGSTNPILKQAGPGIYNISVVDSEFRQTTASYSLYASSAPAPSAPKTLQSRSSSDVLDLDLDVTASETDKNNGKLALTVKGGSAPYVFEWADVKTEYGPTHIYEAEEAEINIPGHIARAYFDASNNAFVDFDEAEGSMTWTVEVARSGLYPIEIIYGAISRKDTAMHLSVNGTAVNESLIFETTRPLLTGWEKTTATHYLEEGKNSITLRSIGESGVNIDYLRVPDHYRTSSLTNSKRMNLAPGDYTVVVTDNKHRTLEKTITVPEVDPFTITELEFKTTASGSLAIFDPAKDSSYIWYHHDAPLFKPEKFEQPICCGTEFIPPTPGNYYVSAKNILTHAESTNRICFSVDQTPDSKNRHKINPASLDKGRVKLWFDASDLDGDGKRDKILPKRGPLPEWKAKTPQNPGKIFTKYKPNSLNGMGVCGFDNVWVSNTGTDIGGFQTILLVYKESCMTFPGKCPFRGLNNYLGKSRTPEKRIFDPDVIDAKTKQGKVYLNGKPIDPFNTANPMDFCLLTVEFPSKVNDRFSTVEGYWEGDIAEMLFIDGTLSETEREGIEEYLRNKWFTKVDLDFQNN